MISLFKVFVTLLALLCLWELSALSNVEADEIQQRRLYETYKLSIYDEVSRPKSRPPRWLGDIPVAAVPQEAPSVSQEEVVSAAAVPTHAESAAHPTPEVPITTAPIQKVEILTTDKYQYLAPILETHSKSTVDAEMEAKFQNWLHAYKAPDPANQEYCMNKLVKRGAHIGPDPPDQGSQFGQDLFTFFNYFKYWPMEGRKGVYVDSGANGAEYLSNTYFYDKCLGWSGLCVEPLTKYHNELSSKRSCKLVPECISDKEELVNMGGEIWNSFVNKSASDGKTQCNTLESMLLRSGQGADNLHIDFWSLDVEGYEMVILRNIDFSKIDIRLILVEDAWIPSRELDQHLTNHGFIKYQHMTIDSVFINRRHLKDASTHTWYPEYFYKWTSDENMFRATKDDYRKKLKCS